MHKLIEFLSNEMPDYADELISSLNATMESVNNVRAAITDMIPTLWKQKERRKDINNYDSMDKELENIANYIELFLSDMDLSVLSKIDAKLDEIIEEENEIEDNKSIEKVDYNKYLVDKTIPYKLLDDFKNTSPYAFTFYGVQYLVDSWYEITIKVCEILYGKDKELFNNIVGNCEIKGRKNAYIAFKNDYPARTIAAKRQLLNTNIVIEQRLSANQHMIVVKRLLDKFKIPRTAIEIFLESDRKPLHGQQHIGKYINKLKDDSKHISVSPVVSSINDSDIKIGKYAQEYFITYFSDTTKEYKLDDFFNKDWCQDNLGIRYPLLKEIDTSIPISEQKGYNSKYGRYWTKTVLQINGKHYILCSQWFEEFRDKLNKWINKQNIAMDNFKQKVYVLPKIKLKICPKCNIKTEKQILFVTYQTEIADINNKLFTCKCNECNSTYIADTIFKSYTRSKDVEKINVEFVEKTHIYWSLDD